jgi:hypothetical protein
MLTYWPIILGCNPEGNRNRLMKQGTAMNIGAGPGGLTAAIELQRYS